MERFGLTDNAIDHNSFFDHLNSTIDTNSEENQTVTANHSSEATNSPVLLDDTTDSTHPVLADLIKTLIAKVDVFQESLIRIEVKMDRIRDEDRPLTGVADVDKLKKFGLPIKSLDGLNTFEESISNDTIKKEIVNILTNIGGKSGNSDGKKILEPIVLAIIEPVFLPSISWSGRGRANEKKIALVAYQNIVNLIALLMSKADKKFNYSATVKALKYKIIKHAPAKYGIERSERDVNVPISVTPKTVYNNIPNK